jgi:hypothetical protein
MINNDDNLLQNDKSLQCLRIEINSHVAVFLYYKKYPKENSEKFPRDLSVIFFYFDKEYVDEKFIYTYLSLAGQIDLVEFGNYVNRKGSKKKRRIVNFAIVKYVDEDAVSFLMDRCEAQMRINDFIENKKNRNVALSYDPLKEADEEEEEFLAGEVDHPDEDGFVEVIGDKRKKRFSKNGVSFKVMKEKNEVGRKKKKSLNPQGDFYWNFQLLDRKRKSK